MRVHARQDERLSILPEDQARPVPRRRQGEHRQQRAARGSRGEGALLLHVPRRSIRVLRPSPSQHAHRRRVGRHPRQDRGHRRRLPPLARVLRRGDAGPRRERERPRGMGGRGRGRILGPVVLRQRRARREQRETRRPRHPRRQPGREFTRGGARGAVPAGGGPDAGGRGYSRGWPRDKRAQARGVRSRRHGRGRGGRRGRRVWDRVRVRGFRAVNGRSGGSQREADAVPASVPEQRVRAPRRQANGSRASTDEPRDEGRQRVGRGEAVRARGGR